MTEFGSQCLIVAANGDEYHGQDYSQEEQAEYIERLVPEFARIGIEEVSSIGISSTRSKTMRRASASFGGTEQELLRAKLERRQHLASNRWYDASITSVVPASTLRFVNLRLCR